MHLFNRLCQYKAYKDDKSTFVVVFETAVDYVRQHTLSSSARSLAVSAL